MGERKLCLECQEMKLPSAFLKYPDCKPSVSNPEFDYCRPCRYKHLNIKPKKRRMPGYLAKEEGWT